MASTTASPTETTAPTARECAALAEQASVALRLWCLALPEGEHELDVKGTSMPQIELRTIIEGLDPAVEGLNDDARMAHAVALLDGLEDALWRVSTLEAPRISVEWCRRAASFAADLMEEALQGGESIDSTNVVALPVRRPT